MEIRRTQLVNAALVDFTRRMHQLLIGHFPEAAAEPEATMHAAIAGQVRRAARYGLVTEEDAAAYVLTAWLMGEDFDHAHSAAQNILMSDLTAAERATALGEWATAVIERLEQP